MNLVQSRTANSPPVSVDGCGLPQMAPEVLGESRRRSIRVPSPAAVGRESQVAVLVPSVKGNDLPDQLGTVPLTRELSEWNHGKGVLITSWKRFKGLEADAVVIVERPARNGNSARANTNRYVARSRAKHLLTVIETQD